MFSPCMVAVLWHGTSRGWCLAAGDRSQGLASHEAGQQGLIRGAEHGTDVYPSGLSAALEVQAEHDRASLRLHDSIVWPGHVR